MVQPSKYIVIYTTFPDQKIAKDLINRLIDMKLAACGNIFELISIYRWQGKMEETQEYGVFIKTKEENYGKVENYLKNNHPYEVPEIISWNIKKGFKPYLQWISEETNSKGVGSRE